MMRVRGRFLLAVALALGAVASARCSSKKTPTETPDDAGDTDGGTWTDLGTPTSVAASQPGYLELGPPGLQLTVAATAQLWAKLYDSSGVLQPTPKMTWTSSAPAVLPVGNTGTVTASGLGYAEV